MRDGDHLCVGRGIPQLFALVVRGRNHALLVDDDGADGHFVLRQRLFRFLERQPHEVFVHLPFAFRQTPELDAAERGLGLPGRDSQRLGGFHFGTRADAVSAQES